MPLCGYSLSTCYKLFFLKTWQNNNIGNSPGFDGDFETALGSINAEVLYMPSETDMCFHIDVLTDKAKLIPNVELEIIPSLWGHIAGAGFSSEDAEFINNKDLKFLN